MSIRVLMLGAVMLGAAGQLACSTKADAAQSSSTETGQFCGGFANLQCPSGLQCVDDPNDSCVPSEGGADCGGICVSADTEPEKPKCNYDDPSRRYVSTDPAACATLRFICEPGEAAFFDSCGCGCERATP